VRSRALAAVFVLFALVNLFNALHKGGDFEVFLDAGERLLTREPLYAGSSPGSGVIGPPAQALLFAPFAWIARADVDAARVTWHVLNVLALGFGVVWWVRAIRPGRATPHAAATHDVLRSNGPKRAMLLTSTPVLLAIAAIALPAQTNFEHQNMNALLLALTGAGALACARGRDAAGGVWIGLAAAFKAFPALLIVALAIGRRWRAAAAATGVAAALTLAPEIWYRTAGRGSTWRQWIAINAEGGWPDRLQNQSILAMTSRLAPRAAWLGPALIGMVLAFLVWVILRSSARETHGSSTVGHHLALALAIAVLVSPIAWDHYWVLMFPALAAAAPTQSPVGRTTFWIAWGLLVLVSPLTLGAEGFNTARWLSSYTVAGLFLVILQGWRWRGSAGRTGP
jgi:hypothetical protein